MAIVHYTARAKDGRTLELPEEAQALGLKPGDNVQVFVNQEGTIQPETLSEAEQQESFQALTTQLFAETDSIERQPGIYTNPQKARLAAMIAEKHRKNGLDV